MYRVLIVDDEPIFRLGIQSCVDWDKMGYRVVGEAENGQKAVQMMEQLQPDLVFLDIRMPVMDGIEVLRWTKEHQPDTEIVVLSCLNEYEYVRQAMRLGALDYLFKPLMEAADITRVAKEALQIIRKRSRSMENTQPDGSRLLRQLSSGTLSLSENEISAELQALGISDTLPPLIVVAFFLFIPNTDSSARREQVIVTARTLVQQDLSGHCACLGEQRGVSLFAISPGLNPELERLCYRIQEYTGIAATVGLSEELSSPTMLRQGIQQAMDSLMRRFVQGYGSVIVYQVPSESGSWQTYLDHSENQIEQALADCNAVLAGNLLEEVLYHAVEIGCSDRDCLCRFAIARILNGICTWRGRIVVEALLSEYFDAINALSNADTLDILIEQFRLLVQNLMTSTGLDPYTSVSPAVRQVQDYISHHYSQNITLDQVADLVHMNKNYFCKLFKKETGDSFVAYLTKIRIEQAIPLLADGRWPAYQVAEMVGYNNYRYFCKLYKKYTGFTPGEVRRPPTTSEDTSKE